MATTSLRCAIAIALLASAAELSVAEVRQPRGFKIRGGIVMEWGFSTEWLRDHLGRDAACTREACLVGPNGLPAPYTKATFFFEGNAFHTVVAEFPPAAFDEIARALTDALGKPTSTVSGTVKSVMGEVDQVREAWRAGDVGVVLEKRGKLVTTGALTLSLVKALQDATPASDGIDPPF
jgi:hypothetical protein